MTDLLLDPLLPNSNVSNLYEQYDRLPPVYQTPATGVWVVSTHKEVGLVMSDKRFRKRAVLAMMQHNFGEEVAPMLARMLFFMDPPEQTAVREQLDERQF